MQELINLLQQKAGLTEEQAKKSLDTIKEFIQSKLPPIMHGMVDNFMGASSSDDEDDFVDGGDSNSFKAKAEKVTTETREKLEDIAEAAKDDMEAFAKDTTEKLSEWADKAEEAAKDAISKLKEMMNDKDKKF